MNRFCFMARGAVALAVGAVAAVAVPQSAQAAGTDLSANTYKLSAEGDGLSMTVVDQALPFTSAYTVSPYSALSLLDSTGLSSAQAGAPYPGFFGPLYRNVNGLIYGDVPPLPPLPGNAASNYPAVTSEKEATAAGYALSADSAADHSTALVNLGSPGAGHRGVSFASAETVAEASGVVRTVGTAGTELLNIENVASIANVSSLASMELRASQAPLVKTETNLGSIVVGGFPVALTPNGVTVVGTNLPIPVKDANEQVNQALKGAGITMRLLPALTEYEPGTKIVKSVTSGAVQITMQGNVPTQGPTTFDLVLGRVVVSGTNTGANSTSAHRVPTAHVSASREARVVDGHEEA